MNVVSWARKEVARLRTHKPKALLPPPSSRSPTTHCSPVSSDQEVVIAADIQCNKCQTRVVDALAKMKGIESVEVNVVEKKVKITCTSTTSK